MWLRGFSAGPYGLSRAASMPRAMSRTRAGLGGPSTRRETARVARAGLGCEVCARRGRGFFGKPPCPPAREGLARMLGPPWNELLINLLITVVGFRRLHGRFGAPA